MNFRSITPTVKSENQALKIALSRLEPASTSDIKASYSLSSLVQLGYKIGNEEGNYNIRFNELIRGARLGLLFNYKNSFVRSIIVI